MITTLDSVSASHRLSASAFFKRVEVAHEGLTAFLMAHLAVVEVAPREDEFWQLLLRRLGRLRFVLLSTPLPFSAPGMGILVWAERLERDLAAVDMTYPDQAPSAHAALLRLRALAADDRCPLVEAIETVVAEYEPRSLTLVTRASRVVGPIQTVLDGSIRRLGLKVTLVPGRGETEFGFSDVVACSGPYRWYAPALIEAPRAPIMVSVCYGIVREADLPDLRLPRSERGPRRLLALTSPTDVAPFIDPVDALPEVSWAWAHGGADASDVGEGMEDQTLARPVVLAGDLGILIDISPGATVLTLQPTLTAVLPHPQRMDADDLESGVFLLLRTEGGGDFVADVADRLLGPRAPELRAMQRAWKVPLLQAIREHGSIEVADHLSHLGSRRASPSNVRRWASAHLIRPALPEDFSAVLSLVGLTDADEIHQCTARMLHTAHQRAGAHIRRMLIRAMLATRIADGFAAGRLDFTLDDSAGGKLSAIRIEQIGQESLSVARSRIGRLHQVDED